MLASFPMREAIALAVLALGIGGFSAHGEVHDEEGLEIQLNLAMEKVYEYCHFIDDLDPSFDYPNFDSKLSYQKGRLLCREAKPTAKSIKKQQKELQGEREEESSNAPNYPLPRAPSAWP